MEPNNTQPLNGDQIKSQSVADKRAPKKTKKGLVIGLVVGLVISMGGVAAAVFYGTVYNNPQNAVIDAFSKALSAKSSQVDGSVSIQSPTLSIKTDVASSTDESRNSSVDADVTMNILGKDHTLTAHVVSTKETVYVKVDGLRKLLLAVLGSENSELIETYYGSLLGKTDSKWVSIKQDNLDSINGDSTESQEPSCMAREMAKLQTDESIRKEIIDVYKANPLLNIENKGSDSDGNHYYLTPVDNAKAKEFFKAMAQTQLVKNLDQCTVIDLKKSLTDSIEGQSSSTNSGGLDVWVDGWSHNLNKVVFSNKDSNGTNFSVNLKTKFNTNPKVTIPEADTTFDDLKTYIEGLQQQFQTTATY